MGTHKQIKVLIMMIAVFFIFAFSKQNVHAAITVYSSGQYKVNTPRGQLVLNFSNNVTNASNFNQGSGTVTVSCAGGSNYYLCNASGTKVTSWAMTKANGYRTMSSDKQYKIVNFFIAFDKTNAHYTSTRSSYTGLSGASNNFSAVSGNGHGTQKSVFKLSVHVANCYLYASDKTVRTVGTSTFSESVASYTISFNSNGGSAVGAVTKNCGQAFTTAKPTKTGYTFKGWSTNGNDSAAEIGPGGSYTVCSGSKTFYAVWTINSYTLTYNANGGSVSPGSKSVNYGAQYGTLPTPKRTGYTFDNWWTAASGGSRVYNTTTMGAKNTTIYAHWKINSYTLTYNANGGSVSPTSNKLNYQANYILPTPTWANHKFLGWYTAASGGTKVSTSTKMGAGNATIYAHWEAGKRLTYNANGGSVDPASKYPMYNGDAYGTLPTPTWANHDFDNWWTAASGGTQVKTTDKMGTANVTIYAHWKRHKYTIKFDKNGGKGTMADQVAETATTHNLNTMSGFTRKGFVFKGWATKQFTHHVSYRDGASVSSLGTKNQTVTLYAVWRRTAPGFIRYPYSERNMFIGDSNNLVGGDGTVWDKVNVHGFDRAHVDRRSADEDTWSDDDERWGDKSLFDPGYFTLKNDYEE